MSVRRLLAQLCGDQADIPGEVPVMGGTFRHFHPDKASLCLAPHRHQGLIAHGLGLGMLRITRQGAIDAFQRLAQILAQHDDRPGKKGVGVGIFMVDVEDAATD
ncbi:MAG: hypothetical protein IPK59_00015 [Rhodospirillaceae bacterium]|nr:hypothetical protein [Rhodospirillaceae bacterium]